MKKNLKIFTTLQIILVLSAIIITFSSFGYNMYQAKPPEPLYIKDVKVSVDGNVPKNITLPYTSKT
ncbi:MAG: hypothetical protein ACTTKD_04750 [Peptoanaerobacter stomatis]|uniref:hypothetical protein n=1 Tax=Peptoanaerobacter stomatis TaxID=796937 RepID=UPI003FA11DDA